MAIAEDKKISELPVGDALDGNEILLVTQGEDSKRTTLNDIQNKIRRTAEETAELFNGIVGQLNNPLLDLPLQNSLNMRTGAGSVNFTRDSGGSYIDRYGVLRTVGDNEPRFEKGGLLIEGASTNEHLHSECDDGWVAARSDITYNYASCPTGEDKAMRIVVNEEGSVYTYIKADTKANTMYTFSICVKHIVGDSNYRVYFHDNSFGTSKKVEFDAISGEITGISDGVNGSVEKLADGWVRASVSYTTEKDEDTDHDYAGMLYKTESGEIDDEFLVYGAQYEQLPFPSSFIPTVDEEVTRSADVCYVDGLDNMPKKFDNYSVVCDVDLIQGLTPNVTDWRRRIMMFSNTEDSVSNWKIFYDPIDTNSNSLIAYFSSSLYTYVAYVDTTKSHRFIMKSLDGLADVYNDGVKNKASKTQQTSDGYSEICNRVYIGSDSSIRQLFGHIKNIKIYDDGLSDTAITMA